jgi:hypothetical protein
MAALNDEVKAFVVRGLACYDTPSQVVNAVKQKFALDVSRQQVALYDPEKYVGRSLSAKWKTLFFDTRALFRKQVAEVPIANRACRLRALGRMAQEAEDQRNFALAMQIIEQAAREVGDMFVNTR